METKRPEPTLRERDPKGGGWHESGPRRSRTGANGSAPRSAAAQEEPAAQAGSVAAELPFLPAIAIEPVRSVGLRFALYTAVFLGFTLSLPVLVGHGDMVVFKEDGPIEWIQFAILVLTVLVLTYTGRTRKTLRECGFLLAMGAAIAAVRELDSFLDARNPIGGWKLPAALIAAGAAGFAGRKRALLPGQCRMLCSYRAFAILWAGFLVAVPFAQLIGHGEFLQLVMGDDYTRDYKRVIEEVSELLGCALLLIGSLELWWQIRLQESGPLRGRFAREAAARRGFPRP